MTNKKSLFDTNIKCLKPDCTNWADAFIIVKLDTKEIRTAICRNHLVSFVEFWLPNIKEKHEREGIENLPIKEQN